MCFGSIRALDPLPYHTRQGCATPTTGKSLGIYSLETVVVIIMIRHLILEIRVEGKGTLFKRGLNKPTCTVADTSPTFFSRLAPEHWQQDLYLSDSK